jgi:3D (Asp-Asp-Asp) domain-containing protein
LIPAAAFMNGDWGEAIVIDPRALERLRSDVRRLEHSARRRAWLGWTLAGTAAVLLGYQASLVARLEARERKLRAASSEVAACRDTLEPAQAALEALAASHRNIIAATEQAPSVGTKSWGRRFTVTKYIPRSPAYGKDNDGYTATMVKADPASRIVAVDPKLIPYGSSVWVEGLGWYRAEDCGGAIKGFRLDLLTATTADAMAFGKQERFVIVVPPDAGARASS